MPVPQQPRSNRLQQLGAAVLVLASLYELSHERFGLPAAGLNVPRTLALGAFIAFCMSVGAIVSARLASSTSRPRPIWFYLAIFSVAGVALMAGILLLHPISANRHLTLWFDAALLVGWVLAFTGTWSARSRPARPSA